MLTFLFIQPRTIYHDFFRECSYKKKREIEIQRETDISGNFKREEAYRAYDQVKLQKRRMVH